MPTRGSGLRCRLVGLDEVYELSFDVARQLRGARFEPEVVVAIARGGFVPARLLCDFLGVDALVSQQIRHYGPGARRQDRAHIEHPLADDLARELGGRRVLVVDDVNETGETLAVARAQIASLGPGELRVAVLHEKASSHQAADFRAQATEPSCWLLYQWAVVEDCLGFVASMDPRPATPQEARSRLDAELGLVLPDILWEKVSPLLAAP